MRQARGDQKLRRRTSKQPPPNVLQFRKQPTYRIRLSAWLDGAKWPLTLLVASPLIGIGAAWLWNNPPALAATTSFFQREPVIEQYTIAFAECGSEERYNCVIDGDTFWLNGEKVRIADINTPEVSEPQCAEEAQLGAQATQRLTALLNAGGFSLETVDREEDVYGRKLRVVTRGGDSLGERLVEEQLAEPWTGRRGSWC